MDADQAKESSRTVKQISKYVLVVLVTVGGFFVVEPLLLLEHSATGLSLHHYRAHILQGLEPQSWVSEDDQEMVTPEVGHTIWQIVVEIRNDAGSTRHAGHDLFFVRSQGQDVNPMPYWTQAEPTSPSDNLPARKGKVSVDLEPTERLLVHALFSLPKEETAPELRVRPSRGSGFLSGPVYALMGLERPAPISIEQTADQMP